MRKRIVHLMRTKKKTWCGRWKSKAMRAVITWNAFMHGSAYKTGPRGRSCEICYHAFLRDAKLKRSKRKRVYFR